LFNGKHYDPSEGTVQRKPLHTRENAVAIFRGKRRSNQDDSVQQSTVTQRIASRRRVLAVIAVLAVATLTVALLEIWRQNPPDPGSEGTLASTGAPRAEPSGVGTPRRCGPINPRLSSGEVMSAAVVRQMKVIHGAACSRDWATLASQMDNPFSSDYGEGLTPQETIRKWQDDPDILNVLSAVLETQVHVDQGGFIYRLGDATLVIARGTFDRPSPWVLFVRDCIFLPVAVREYVCGEDG